MDTPTYVPDTTLPQSQQDTSDPPPSPGSSQVSIEARYLSRGDVLRVSTDVYLGISRGRGSTILVFNMLCKLCPADWCLATYPNGP